MACIIFGVFSEGFKITFVSIYYLQIAGIYYD
jgi:hypothetical protein